jgi:hypothetical protein
MNWLRKYVQPRTMATSGIPALVSIELPDPRRDAALIVFKPRSQHTAKQSRQSRQTNRWRKRA